MVRHRSVFGLAVLCTALTAASAAAAPPTAIPPTDIQGQAEGSPQAEGSSQAEGSPQASPTPRIEGRMDVVAPLPPPREGMLEVYLRMADDTITVAIVPVAISGDTATGAHVSFAVRDDGMHTYTDRSGTARTVRRVIAVTPPALVSQRLDDFTIMLGALVILMATFGVVAAIVARSKRRPSILEGFDDGGADEPLLPSASDLPEDPAQAMAELARRSETDT